METKNWFFVENKVFEKLTDARAFATKMARRRAVMNRNTPIQIQIFQLIDIIESFSYESQTNQKETQDDI